MKLNKYIGMAVMPMLFAACQNDMVEESIMQQDQPIYTLSGKMDKGVNSRAQIQLGNPDESGEIFMWNEGDSFALYQGGPETEVMFNISSDYSEAADGDKSTATFSSDVAVYPGTYVAVYPQVPIEDNGFVFDLQRNLDFSNATTKEAKDAVWKEYFKNNMFMVARGELTAEGPNDIQFKHQCALARITYHNESGSDQVLISVSLTGQNQFWGTWARQNMDGMGGGGSITSWYQLDFNGLQVAAGDSTDIYMFFFPAEINDDGIVELHFSVVQGGDRSVKLPASDIAAANGGAKRFQEGMRYWFDVTSTKGGAVLSKNYSTAPITFDNVEFVAALQKVLGPDVVTIDPATGFGTMIEADVLGITRLDFGWGNYQIPSLKGIEHFKNLTYLHCCDAGLLEADLSQNTALVSLYLSGNLDLTSLNIDNCMQLQMIDVSATGLSSLNIPNKEKLWQLRYGQSNLSFDLTQFPNLTSLSVYWKGLTSLDFIPERLKAQLQFFECYGNEISSIDLSEFPNLMNLSCYFNPLKSLDLTPVPQLLELNCHSCYIERLDITPLENLNTLYCGTQNGINLVLVATDAQKDRWRNEWSNPNITWGLNDRAYLEGEEPKEIPEGSGTGSDFGNGGEF